MCGIAGIISAERNRFSKRDVENMSSCLSHRGPDGTFTWENTDGTAFLGHNRLAIIDLTDAAAQPMHYLQRYTIVHNGEIYNYKELREQLSKEGYRFKSSSDTEVILAAYDQWKENCLQQFEGMFAFAIWDSKEQCIFIARDRFGEKPLYYYVNPDKKVLWFASELKSMYGAGFNKHEYNGNLLLQYLTTGISYTADSFQTFHNLVQKLPARHYLKYSPFDDSDPLEIEPYYDIDKLNKVDLTPGQAVDQFRSLFFDSVNKRLRSDVPIGTSLSGGIDSSSVVAAINSLKQTESVQKAFTSTFPGFERDEFLYADLIAKQFGLQHHLAHPGSASLITDLEKFLSVHDEPVASASVYAQYKVYELAKAHGIKVVLDGQGADEVLAGYGKYLNWFLQELYNSKRKTELENEINAFAGDNEPGVFGIRNKLAAMLPSVAAIQLEKKAFRKQKTQPDINVDFRNTHLNRRTVYKPIIKRLNDILYFDVFGGSLEELLRYADRNAMAHGIEVRLPFLNYQLVEFIFSLPATYKMHDGYTKYILRQSMDGLLPKQVTWRKDKVGFEPPQQQWMQDKQIQDKIHEAKKDLVKKGILNPSSLNNSISPKAAHEPDNYDWRYLSAASIL